MMLSPLVLLLFSILGTSRSHVRPRITDFHVPSPAKSGDSVQLRCGCELGNEQLYSVKWYKDEIEFLRYVPEEKPRLMAFPMLGIIVDVSKSDGSSVFLRNVSSESSGNYTCKVYTDAPHFRELQETQELIVIDPPPDELQKPPPVVTIEFVRLRCGYETLVNETFHSIGWFKDAVEFLRYVPASVPQFVWFPQDGFYVDLMRSDGYTVVLRNLSLKNFGNFTCEVSERKLDSSEEASTTPKQVEETSSSHGCLLREQESCLQSMSSWNSSESREDLYCRYATSYLECLTNAANKCHLGAEEIARIRKLRILYIRGALCNEDSQTYKKTSSSPGCLLREQESCVRPNSSWNISEAIEGMESCCRYAISYLECLTDAANKCELGAEEMARIRKLRNLYIRDKLCNEDSQPNRETSSSHGCLLREQESCVRPNSSWNFPETQEGMDSYCRYTIRYLECMIEATNKCEEAGAEEMVRIRKRHLYLRDELCNEASGTHRALASNLQCISQTFRSVPETCSPGTQRTDYLISAIESRIGRPSATQPGFCMNMLVSFSCAAIAFEISCGEPVGAAFASSIVNLESDFEKCPPEVAAQLPQAIEAYRSVMEAEKEAAGATSRRRK